MKIEKLYPECKEIIWGGTRLKEKYGKQIFATPKKQGAETGEANINAGLAAANQICEYFATGCTKFQVNK